MLMILWLLARIQQSIATLEVKTSVQPHGAGFQFYLLESDFFLYRHGTFA
jgi:hypothetical protein